MDCPLPAPFPYLHIELMKRAPKSYYNASFDWQNLGVFLTTYYLALLDA